MKRLILFKLVVFALFVLACCLAVNLAWNFKEETFQQTDVYVYGGPEPTVNSILEGMVNE